MSPVLEISLILASIAIVVFVTTAMVLLFQFRKQAERLIKTTEDLKADIATIGHDAHEVLAGVKLLTTRANQQFHEVEHVVQTARIWCDRVNLVATEVGAAIEPPLTQLARTLGVYCSGFAGVLHALFKTKTQRGEDNHVRE
jgi:uncharacterized protein YoxC